MSDLLPPNALPSERALALATARVGDVPVPIGALHNPATCPAALLPWLAWAESVDEWDPAWTTAQKRAVIAASRMVHEKKGTVGAIRLAIEALGSNITFEEWFEQDPPGDPYTFRVSLIVDQEASANEAAINRIERVVLSAKNLRSHAEILPILTRGGTAYAAAVLTATDTITIDAESAP
jgi:phage tail P2-like protein